MNSSARDLALHAARKMLDKGAEDLVVLEIGDPQAAFDYGVIANGRSERQSRTLIDEIYHFCKRHQLSHHPVEGEAGWYLIDCIEVVAHAFTPQLRDYYQLDHLWRNARVIDHNALLTELPDPDQGL